MEGLLPCWIVENLAAATQDYPNVWCSESIFNVSSFLKGSKMKETANVSYGEIPTWKPQRPRLRPLWLLVTWLVLALSLLVAAAIVPGVSASNFGGALITAALI